MLKIVIASVLSITPLLAQQTFMPIVRTTLDPGRYESPVESLEGQAECTYSFDAAATTGGWDNAALRVTLEVLRSTDGGQTWTVVQSASFVGASRGKGGGLPSISVIPQGGDGALRGQHKIALSINRRMSIGVDAIKR